MCPPKKKRKTKKLNPSPTPDSHSILSFPDDLVLNCLTRVSRLYYPTLSLVSKKFRSLIASPELYKVRSLLGFTESCLYVRFENSRDFDSRCFTLCRKPNTLTKKSDDDILIPVPFPDSPQPHCSNVVSIGSCIYFIGGYTTDNVNYPSSNVWILDCRSHTWHQAPNMQEIRKSQGANVVDGKIYVLGRPVNNDSSNWIQVFDPKTGIWNSLSIAPPVFCKRELISSSTVIDGKISMYGVGGQGVAFDPKDGTCELIEWDLCRAWVVYAHCVVQNVLIYYREIHDKAFRWFDTKESLWKVLKGLDGLTRKIGKHSCVKLADYGGKIAVLWDKCLAASRCKEKMIWFAVISLERKRNDDEEEDEIWGNVEFLDIVLRVPKSYKLSKAISTTL